MERSPTADVIIKNIQTLRAFLYLCLFISVSKTLEVWQNTTLMQCNKKLHTIICSPYDGKNRRTDHQQHGLHKNASNAYIKIAVES
jgi:hypothetical protein